MMYSDIKEVPMRTLVFFVACMLCTASIPAYSAEDSEWGRDCPASALGLPASPDADGKAEFFWRLVENIRLRRNGVCKQESERDRVDTPCSWSYSATLSNLSRDCAIEVKEGTESCPGLEGSGKPVPKDRGLTIPNIQVTAKCGTERDMCLVIIHRPGSGCTQEKKDTATGLALHVKGRCNKCGRQIILNPPAFGNRPYPYFRKLPVRETWRMR